MENKAIRRTNLLALLDETSTGKWVELAERCNVSVAYLSQVKSRKINRDMGDDLARRLESGMGKPVGWMDTIHTKNKKYGDPTPEEWGLVLAYRNCDRGAKEAIFELCQQLAAKKT